MDEFDAVARTEIQPGWDVVDADDQLVGRVEAIGDASFTIRVEGPVDATIGVPYTEIESADDGRVVLAVSGEDLDAAIDTGVPDIP